MKNGYKLSLAAIAASISLVGCGSDSTTAETTAETVTGQFIDAAVEGLNYTCSSGATGTTNNKGEYTCNVGDTVTFSVGAYVLGTADASSGVVTPYSLYPDNDTAAIDVAQLLQTLDNDEDGVITIPADFTDLDDVDAAPGDAEFEAVVEDAIPDEIDGGVLVDETEATDSLDENVLKALLADKTFYNVGDDWIDRVVFNADLTSVTWSQVLGGTDTGTDSLQLDGDQLIVTSGEDGRVFRIEIAEETTDYLLLNLLDESGTVFEQNRFYFDQAVAEASFEEWILITEEKLSGKTFYDQDYHTDQNNVKISDVYATMTLSNGVLTRTELSVNVNTQEETVDAFELDYTIIDGKVKVDLSIFDEGYSWFTLDSESTDAWNVTMEDDRDADGIIDSVKTDTWYLSKPEGYPASL